MIVAKPVAPAAVPVPPPGVAPAYFGIIEKPIGATAGTHDELATYVPLDHSRSVFLRDKLAAADTDTAYNWGSKGRFYEQHADGLVTGLVDALKGAIVASGIEQVKSLPVNDSTRLYDSTKIGDAGIMLGYPGGPTTMYMVPLDGSAEPQGQAVVDAVHALRGYLDVIPPDHEYDDTAKAAKKP